MEEILLDEIDMLRDDMREDIATGARATHKAFGERLQAIQETVDAMRAQLGAARTGKARSDYAEPGQSAPSQATAQVSVPAATFEANGTAAAATVGGQAGVAPGGAGPGIPPAGNPGSSSGTGTAGGRAHVPGGVVRHMETVQVTTRSTIVDQSGDAQDRGGTVYGAGYRERDSGQGGYRERDSRQGGYRERDSRQGGYRERDSRQGGYRGRDDGGYRERHSVDDGSYRERESERGSRGWSAPPSRRHAGEPDEESWTDQRLGGRYERREVGRRSRARDRDDDPGDDERWSSMRAGDRWAAVRTDERGRELRMGERRAAVHADDSGSELRIEDRWASVRREESCPEREVRWEVALPPATRTPAPFDAAWREPAREPVRARRGRRRRDDDDDGYRGSRPSSRYGDSGDRSR